MNVGSWTREDALTTLSVLSVLVALTSFWAAADGGRVPLALGLAFAVLALWRPERRNQASPALSQVSYLCVLLSIGCLAFATWNLFLHPGPRWVHRFVIYSGYSATYGTLATLAQVLARRFQAGVPWSRIGLLFLAIFVAGSVCIYVLKEQTVRRHGAVMRTTG
jgi:hypothetical protein